jgi:hypothetical protein
MYFYCRSIGVSKKKSPNYGRSGDMYMIYPDSMRNLVEKRICLGSKNRIKSGFRLRVMKNV